MKRVMEKEREENERCCRKIVRVEDFMDEQPSTSGLVTYDEQQTSSNDSVRHENTNKNPTQSDESVCQVSFDDIKTGDYLLVNVNMSYRKAQAKKYLYICLVQNVQEDGVDVVFLKKLHEPNVFILKQDDYAFVFEDEIQGKLKELRLAN